jgi:RNA polymerase sigma factor (sigma-70 family)
MATPSLDGLLSRLRDGDREADELFVGKLSPWLEGVARTEMGREACRWAEPADLAQQVLVELLPEIRAPQSELTANSVRRVLRRRVQFRVLDLLRRHRLDKGWSHVPPSHEGPEVTNSRHLDRREFLRHLDGVLETLPEVDRTIVRAVALEERSYVEVSAMLGNLSADAVRKRYTRAVKHVRVALRLGGEAR